TPIPTVAPLAPRAVEAARGGSLPVAEAAPFPPRTLAVRHAAPARSQALWVWAVLLAVLVVGAALLALFAFAR
ncbi:MAG TPA: hypothetical protein VFW87_22235, partial [Pirellulales bacterium]|nr:hypothetical protein [Pirellulales bacterium]